MPRPTSSRFGSDLNARTLEVFLAICDAGSMTGAAAALGVSQAAISQQAGRLEKLVGSRLFMRGGGGLTLTPAGLQFRYHAMRILEATRQAELAMSRHNARLLPRIVCGLMDTMGEILGPTLIEALTPLAENIEIASSIRYQLIDGVGAPLYDIAVVAQEATIPGARWFELVSEPGVLVVPKDFFRGRVELDALAERLPMIRFNAQRRLGRLIDTYLQKITLGVPRRFEFDRVSMLTHLVSTGAGWAITTPYSLLQSPQSLERIDVHPLPPPGLNRTIVLGAFGDSLLNIPEMLVQESRRTLARARDTRIARIAPRAVDEIRIPDA